MPDSCEECGSYRLKPLAAINGTRTHPPEAKSWECLECGNVQQEEKDYDYYEGDFV